MTRGPHDEIEWIADVSYIVPKMIPEWMNAYGHKMLFVEGPYKAHAK